jgi:hypothetical protein
MNSTSSPSGDNEKSYFRKARKYSPERAPAGAGPERVGLFLAVDKPRGVIANRLIGR